MSELLMDYGDHDWLQGVADTDQADNILSIGRATRIVNSITEQQATIEHKCKRIAELQVELKQKEHEITQIKNASRQHKERKEFLEILTDRLDEQIADLKKDNEVSDG